MKLSSKVSRLVLLCLLACQAGSIPAFAQTPSFEDLRREHDAVRIESASQLRTGTGALEGKVIDLHGEISGIMTRDGVRTVLFKMGEEMVVLAATPETGNANLLRTGTLVRLLARVNGDNKDGVYSILAVSGEGVASKPQKVKSSDSYVDNADIAAPMEATIETLPGAPETGAGPVGTKPATASKPSPKVTIIKGTKTKAPAKNRPSQKVAQLPEDKPTLDEVEDVIAAQVPAYSAIVRQHNKKLKPEVVQEISIALLRAGYKHNMDPRFLAAIIAVESDFDVLCLSSSGAMGLGQMMPFNLKEAGVKNPWNPTENVMGTARLLRNLLDSYKNRSDGTLLAVAAYNAGSGAVRRAGYKVPNGAQVQRYVWKVYNRYKAFAPDMFD